LEDAVGKEVALSITGSPDNLGEIHKVLAMRTPDGLAPSPPSWRMALGLIVHVFRTFFVALVGGVIVTFICWLVVGEILGRLMGSDTTGSVIALILGLMLIPLYLFLSFRTMYKNHVVRTALN
jgi:hypothetical protein